MSSLCRRLEGLENLGEGAERMHAMFSQESAWNATLEAFKAAAGA